MAESPTIPISYNHSTFLLDTCFFIDAYERRSEFVKFISDMQKANIDFVTLILVKYEFIKSKTIEVINKKTQYFELFPCTVLSKSSDLDSLIPSIMEYYKQYIDGVSLVDLYLAACIKKYRNLFLLTKNHKDFPTNIYTRDYIFPIESSRDIQTYALYRYKPNEIYTDESVMPF